MIEPFDGLGIKVERTKVCPLRSVYIAHQHIFYQDDLWFTCLPYNSHIQLTSSMQHEHHDPGRCI